MNEVIVFASAGELQREFARAMAWVGVVTAALLVLALWMARAQARAPGGRGARDGQRLAVMALVFLAVGFSLSVFFTFRQFTELRLDADALVLRYAEPWRAERRIPLAEAESVLVGGGESRGQPWVSGCRLRISLHGGGHRVSALREDLPRAECEALRNRLSALVQAAPPLPAGTPPSEE